ncbi:MAG TPA: alpha/beta fold hydrolase [Candidatus Elarobacter sp.]|nr:alpha/beta fold hydrolase [Candidatus Elarobacter sp.]
MKKLVRPLLAGAGVTGALAATNRALGNAPLPTNALGGTRVPWTWRGAEIFATAAGAGAPIILVHGVGTGASSYEFRRLFPLLAQNRRAVAVDLLGCGLSDRPRRPYTAELFVEQIVDAVDALAGEPAAVVASGHGAAFAIRAAARAGGRITNVAAIVPTGLSAAPERGRAGALTALFRAPVLGETAYNALASRASIRWTLEHYAYGDPSHVTAEVVDHYYAVAHQPGARYVPAALFGGALDCDVARDLPFLDVPLQVLWGEKAPASNPRRDADEFVRLARDARLATFANSGTLPHDEEPAAVADALESFLRRDAARADGVDASTAS